MSRLNHTDNVTVLRVPRASGDEPNGGTSIDELGECSPRERG